MNDTLYVVENLNTVAWVFQIFPYLLRLRTKGISPKSIHYIDATKIGLIFFRATKWLIKCSIEKLDFRLIDIRDETGTLIRLRIAYQDIAEVQGAIIQSRTFQNFVKKNNGTQGRYFSFLKKSVGIMDPIGPSRGMLWRALLLIQLCKWHVENEQSLTAAIFFMEKRPWFDELKKYASKNRVILVGVTPAFSFSLFIRRLAPPRFTMFFRALRSILYQAKLHDKQGVKFSNQRGLLNNNEVASRLAVEFTGCLNLDRPELASDLFFLGQSVVSGKDIVLTFGIPQDPLDEKKTAEMARHGVNGLVLYPSASVISSAPQFVYVPEFLKSVQEIFSTFGNNFFKNTEEKWLQGRMQDFNATKEYWAELFRLNGIKIYFTWYRYDERHCAIADAMQSVDGITAIYQRACQLYPSPEIAVDADIMFGYSPADAEIERRSGSVIPYHVAVGYFGDHRFPLLRNDAMKMREKLKERGAQFIIAYFDENSVDDPRWHTGHEFMRENYQFLLERLLTEPWLGLILKPKNPTSLRRRLGSVAGLLEKAIATGRCHLFETGVLHGAYPPAGAALAADIAIHGHLSAANAGMEAALAGIPTLLLDREGFPASPLYRMGKGRVVFICWSDLWETLVEHRTCAGGIPGFGDWSPMINELDPFRDGRAAERVGTYLNWLLEGFKAGLPREKIMADAMERYCKIWGADKVTENIGYNNLRKMK